MNPDEHPFSTQEAILSYCLYIAGIEFLDDRQPVSNLYDAEILAKLGHRGEKLWDAGQEAWKAKEKGSVQYHFKLTPRCSDLIRAYRLQCVELDQSDGKASELVLKIMESAKAGAILPDEALLRIACVNLKTRGDFMNLWKSMVPLLRIPVDGKAKHFDTTATVKTQGGGNRTVEAKGVQRPGFKVVSLNLSEEKRKHMGL